MKGTDTFHLGDKYYVFVNYWVEQDGPITRCFVWVGESWMHSTIINEEFLSVVEIGQLSLAKKSMSQKLIKYKNQLIEIIKNQ